MDKEKASLASTQTGFHDTEPWTDVPHSGGRRIATLFCRSESNFGFVMLIRPGIELPRISHGGCFLSSGGLNSAHAFAFVTEHIDLPAFFL